MLFLPQFLDYSNSQCLIPSSLVMYQDVVCNLIVSQVTVKHLATHYEIADE